MLWRCCTRDEGRPLGLDVQALGSNHLKLLWLRVRVVSVKEKVSVERYQVRIREMSESELLMKCREDENDVKTSVYSSRWDKSKGNLVTGLDDVRHKGSMNLIQALVWNVRTCRSSVKGEIQVGTPHKNKSTNIEHRGGAARSSYESCESNWNKGAASLLVHSQPTMLNGRS